MLGTLTASSRPSGVTATPNGLPGTLTIAVPTPLSCGDMAVTVLHPGEGSARSGRTSGAYVGVTLARTWLACGWAGLEVQPAHPIISPAAAQAAAARARMSEWYAATSTPP